VDEPTSEPVSLDNQISTPRPYPQVEHKSRKKAGSYVSHFYMRFQLLE
jgi:hypothetical protein